MPTNISKTIIPISINYVFEIFFTDKTRFVSVGSVTGDKIQISSEF
jgi:hypothetical protein